MIISATGHRPQKLGGFNGKVESALNLTARYALEKYKPSLVITGMALGWDMAMARNAISMGIEHHAYIPFRGHWDKRSEYDKREYRRVLENSSRMLLCTPHGYHPRAFQIRNEMMVDDCDLLVALCGNIPGGTKNCIEYAEKNYVTVANFFDYFERCRGPVLQDGN